PETELLNTEYKVSPITTPSGPLEGQDITIQFVLSTSTLSGKVFPPSVDMRAQIVRMFARLLRYNITTVFPERNTDAGQQSQTSPEVLLAITDVVKDAPKLLEFDTT